MLVNHGYRDAGRPTASELCDRKSRAVEAATSLFISRGFVDTAFVDIARAVRMGTNTLYRHFGSKEAMFEVVARRAATSIEIGIPDIDANSSLKDQLLGLAFYIYAVVTDPQISGFVLLMIAERCRFPELNQDVSSLMMGRLYEQVAHAFCKLEFGKLSETVPAGVHSRDFTDLIFGTSVVSSFGGSRGTLDIDDKLRSNVELFMRGLG